MRRERAVRPVLLLLGLGFLLAAVVGFLLYQRSLDTGLRTARVFAWLRNSSAHPEWAVSAGQRCEGAPFQQPTDGLIGFYWDDSFRLGHRHQGLDIFGGGDANTTPVYAAYPGYLTRMEDWKSSVILRVPDDPLSAGRQIWTYYTHMAGPGGDSYIAPDFPPGTHEVWVEAGTLLGYQGNYSGTPGNPVGVHLHFSIVLDDGRGRWRNELEIQNTIDPSPYFGMPLNAKTAGDAPPVCSAQARNLHE